MGVGVGKFSTVTFWGYFFIWADGLYRYMPLDRVWFLGFLSGTGYYFSRVQDKDEKKIKLLCHL